MNFCFQASDRPDAARHARIVFWKDSPWQFRDFTRWLWLRMSLAIWILTPLLSRAQSTNVSREVSIFNFGQPAASSEAVSREVSVFDFGQPAASSEAVSREVSVFDFGQVVANIEAISREVSVYDRGFNLLDSISREVGVYNYGFNHFALAVGFTVVLAGNTGGVSVAFSTLAPVTNVQVAVDFPQNLLTNWSLQQQPPFAGTVLVSNNSRLYLTFSPTNGQSIINTQQLGRINFASISNQSSAFLPLPVADATAPMLDGMIYTPYKALQNGEVVVIRTNSLVRQVRTNGQEYITLYGLNGTNYIIQSTTNLASPIVWQTAFSGLVPSVGLTALTPIFAATNKMTFYRGLQQ